MKQMVGYCTNCGTEVMDITRSRGKRKLDNYREHTMEISDGSLLNVAVCDTCKSLLVSGNKVEETSNRILKHHKIYWQENRKDDHGDTPPDAFDKLVITDPNSNILKNRAKKLGLNPELSKENKKKEEDNLKEKAKQEKEEQKRLKEIARLNEKAKKEREKIDKEAEIERKKPQP